ncbi:MAG: pilus assembly protein PilM [Candidatus Omnitrophota bacterium]|nr:pilus assembly protein PilM [Candidatus Omnitrophota bacterium]
MSDLGIYFGPKSIDVSEAKGRKLVNNLQIPVFGIIGNELDEKVPTEIKLVAAFNDAFRRNKIQAKEANLCLSGKDLIMRTFEIPLLPKEELHAAINFEAKKYIPFKVEELISDYQVELDKLSRTNIVLFMGIKKDTFDKYFSTLNQLNIKINSIEYAGFSALRILKLARINESGVIGILCFDSRGEDEINFTVLDNGFPLFSRDINLSSVPSDLDQAQGESGLSPDKLKAEVRVSLDYYHRKFPAKAIKNIFVVSSPDWRQELEVFINDLGLPNKFIDISKIINKPMAFSSGLVKSYSAAISKAIPIKVRVNLIESKARALKPAAAAAGLDLTSLLKNIKLDFRVITAGVLLCAATFIYGIFQLAPLKQNLGQVVSKRSKVAKISPDSSYASLNIASLKDKKTLDNLDNLIKKQLYVTEVLNIVPPSLPRGVWLTKFSLAKREEDKKELTLAGMSYLGESSNEFQAINKFFNNLRDNPEFTKYFKDISIVSIDHTQFLQATVTTFSISCKTYQEAK